ncbi:MAG: amidohydrolase family protein [Actinomycetota bacterium]|nr:amidohydrolase family protein [Actinomycetota bacterium]
MTDAPVEPEGPTRAPRETPPGDRPEFDVLVTGGEVVLPPVGVLPIDLGIRGNRIIAHLQRDAVAAARNYIDARGKLVFPGLVDPHVHIGYTAGRGMPLDAMPEHFDTETASALVGGITTLIVMYRNEARYEDIWDEMVRAGEQHSRIDFGYTLGITGDHHREGIADHYKEFGISSFKLYMVYRGDEAGRTGNAYVRYDDGLLWDTMEAVAGLPGAVAMVHAENIEVIARIRERVASTGRDDLAAWSESRPDFTEAEAVRRVLYLGEQSGCPVYIPHLSCAESLVAVAEHRARASTPAYVETCPQYLTHTMDSDVGLLGKVNPPLRRDRDRDALWSAIAAGSVDTIGTDHCGLRRRDKGPGIWNGTPGFPGMATMLPVLLQGVRDGLVSLLHVAAATSLNPARVLNLYPRKGTLEVGADADLVIVDPTLTRRVTPELLRSRSDFSIYEGRELTGWPVLTMLRGNVLMRDGEVVGAPGYGRYLRRA